MEEESSQREVKQPPRQTLACKSPISGINPPESIDKNSGKWTDIQYDSKPQDSQKSSEVEFEDVSKIKAKVLEQISERDPPTQKVEQKDEADSSIVSIKLHPDIFKVPRNWLMRDIQSKAKTVYNSLQQITRYKVKDDGVG